MVRGRKTRRLQRQQQQQQQQGGGVGFSRTSDKPSAELWDAVHDGNTQRVAELLATPGVSVNYKYPGRNYSIFGVAVYEGRHEIAEMLLNGFNNKQVNPNVMRYDDKETPLMHTAGRGDVEMVRILLNDPMHRADINRSDRFGTALIRAAWGNSLPNYGPFNSQKHIEITNMLFNYPHQRLDMLKKTEEGETAFFAAAACGNIQLIQMLLDYPHQGKIGINEPNNDRETPFFAAVKHGHIDVVRLLLNDPAKRAHISRQNNDGETPLHAACRYGHSEIVQLLLNDPADRIDINRADFKGITPLHIAAKNGYIEIVQQLLNDPQQRLIVDYMTQFALSHNLFDESISRLIPKLPILYVEEGSENAITYNSIMEGDELVDFHDESKLKRFYKSSTYDSLGRKNVNPFTMAALHPHNLKYYQAHIIPPKKSEEKPEEGTVETVVAIENVKPQLNSENMWAAPRSKQGGTRRQLRRANNSRRRC
jgi:ankyrin repeat protein